MPDFLIQLTSLGNLVAMAPLIPNSRAVSLCTRAILLLDLVVLPDSTGYPPVLFATGVPRLRYAFIDIRQRPVFSLT